LRYKWGIQNSCSPSRFIKEIDEKYLELPPDFYPLVPQEGQAEKEQFVPEAYRKAMGGKTQPRTAQISGRRHTNVNQVSKDFTPSDPGLVRVGIKVEHPRFGIGEVTQMEGADSNIKATVEFPIGKKQLLLKFAKLRVVE